MFDWLTELVSGSPLAYPVIAAAVCVDGFLPVVPGESLVITGAILAADGDLLIWLVLAAALAGALTGDNLSYGLGALVGRPAAGRLFRGNRSRRLLDWAQDQLGERGRVLIVAARFIPGGRTAVTFSAGMLQMPWRRFLAADAVGCALWAVWATGLGFVGGETFKDSVWKPLLAAVAVACLVAGIGELWRRRTESTSKRLSRPDRGQRPADERGAPGSAQPRGKPVRAPRGRSRRPRPLRQQGAGAQRPVVGQPPPRRHRSRRTRPPGLTAHCADAQLTAVHGLSA